MEQTQQKIFVLALIAAVLLTIVLGIGIDTLLIKSAGLPDWLVNGLPWAALAVMGASALALLVIGFRAGRPEADLRGRALSVIAAILLGALLFTLYDQVVEHKRLLAEWGWLPDDRGYRVPAWPLILPALLLAVAPLGLALAGAGGIRGFNRLMPHVIGWSIAATVVFILRFTGDRILDALTWEVDWPAVAEGQPEPTGFLAGLSRASANVVNYVSDFLTAFVGVFVNISEGTGLFAALMFVSFALAIAAVGWIHSINDRPGRIERLFVGNIMSKIAAIPMVLTTLGIFVGATLWTVAHSFTTSGLLPKFDTWDLFEKAGFFSDKSETGRNIPGVLMQYERLWGEPRWIQSIVNLGIYGICSLIFTLVIGFMLAAALDRKIRFENTFRTIFLYPFALSFVVTGLVWQWILNPEFGIQKIVRDMGFSEFVFDPLGSQDYVMFGLLIAGLWQGTGLVMCIMLAGLRGIDEDIWKASRVDGIPMWKTYIFIVIPMMRPVFITALVLITSGIVRLYDLVVAQTSGGPGLASEVPAKYVYDKMFTGQNLGQGFAASTMMLVTVVIILIPWAYLEFSGRKKA